MSFKDLVDQIVSIVDDSIVPLLFMLAFVAMLIGIFRYFFLQGEENLQKGRQFMLWGGLAFVLMFTIWGVVKILLTTFGL